MEFNDDEIVFNVIKLINGILECRDWFEIYYISIFMILIWKMSETRRKMEKVREGKEHTEIETNINKLLWNKLMNQSKVVNKWMNA